MTTPLQDGRFSIPVRIFLTAEQRQRLAVLVRAHDIDVADLLSELLISFIEHMPDAASDAAPADAASTDAPAATAAEIANRRAEVQRLHARIEAAGADAPGWLRQYVADLERELARLVGNQG